MARNEELHGPGGMGLCPCLEGAHRLAEGVVVRHRAQNHAIGYQDLHNPECQFAAWSWRSSEWAISKGKKSERRLLRGRDLSRVVRKSTEYPNLAGKSLGRPLWHSPVFSNGGRLQSRPFSAALDAAVLPTQHGRRGRTPFPAGAARRISSIPTQ